MTIRKGKLDFIGNYREKCLSSPYGNACLDVNPRWYQEYFTGVYLECLNEIHAVFREGHYDYSDAMTDYFNCAWYLYVKIGTWNKPYILEK